MSYIPRQEKVTKEKLSVPLDVRLIERLDRYCKFLDSDREHVVAKALEIAFSKDKEFTAWCERTPS